MNTKYKIIKIKDDDLNHYKVDLSRYTLVSNGIFQIKLYHLNNLETYMIKCLHYENSI